MSLKSITNARSINASHTDESISRPRTLIIVAETAAGPGYAKIRAEFEARIRKARGDEAKAKVAGWRDSSGAVWAVNRQVWVSAPAARLGGWYMVSEVELQLDADGGKIATLTLKIPDAYLAALDFTKRDAVDIATAEGKKSFRGAIRAGKQSLRGVI